jgi:hypothetical protein
MFANTIAAFGGALAFAVGALATTASAGSFTRGCAARDVQLLTMIEEREGANAISPQKSSDAVLAMMHARTICHEGRVLDALALYDSISESIALSPLLSERRQ